MKIILSLFVFFVVGVNQLNAQAFDGLDDYKVFIGYMNLEGKSGLEVAYDYGLNDILSTGGYVKYALVDDIEVSDDVKVKLDGLDKFDLGVFIRAHLSEPLSMSTKIDPYLGGELSLKVIGAHAGVKYNFGEVLGVYGQVTRSFSGFILDEENSDFINIYAKKTIISGGITLYF